jgi:hypothetical protein
MHNNNSGYNSPTPTIRSVQSSTPPRMNRRTMRTRSPPRIIATRRNLVPPGLLPPVLSQTPKARSLNNFSNTDSNIVEQEFEEGSTNIIGTNIIKNGNILYRAGDVTKNGANNSLRYIAIRKADGTRTKGRNYILTHGDPLTRRRVNTSNKSRVVRAKIRARSINSVQQQGQITP